MKAASGGKSQPELLSTHPSNQRRIDELKRWIPDAKALAIKVNAKR
jgi:Zn-dependent protease with chaperone function|tara:strand:- start:134 stop:271 length:138 start_codon:yes stop_codon:yes gene_type:complete